MRLAARPLCCLCLLGSLILWHQASASAFSTRIFGGEEAGEGDWPWMTGLRITFEDGTAGFCGGQLISPDWVLTAAHCLIKDNDAGSRVNASHVALYYDAPIFPDGSFPAENDSDEISALALVHGQFVYNNLLKGYDIALIRVSQPPAIAPYPDLADMPRIQALEAASPLDRNDRLTALGWGEFTPSSGISETLQQVALDYITREHCGSYWFRADTSILICANEPAPPDEAEFGQDTCQGDSGGPLLDGTPDVPVIVGITSFGSVQGCGLAHVPSGYTSTADMAEWIETSTAAPPPDTDARPLIDAAIHIPRYHSLPANPALAAPYDIDFRVRNDSLVNAATLQRLTLTRDDADDLALEINGSVCPEDDCDLSGLSPFAPEQEIAGKVSVATLPSGEDQTLILSLQLATQEHDYRSSNNRPTVRLFLTDKPDLNLVAPGFVRGTFRNQQRRATVNIRLENLSTHATADQAGLTVVLPAATQLLNATSLQCDTSDAGLICPVPALDPGGQHSMALTLSSEDGLPRTLHLQADASAGSFGAGETRAAVTLQYPTLEDTLPRVGSRSGFSIGWLLLALPLLSLRRRGA
ncbi:serine protease [Alcanivorax sp. JB21]|uniref:serine protease n=1 Tax=Alcanivorax limicola TaxID=2874102 RepID=UPI001CBFE76E|nr:serine protease [Alcanivorax limicola]MBZ2189752.1 serine protease [Alcanivorax limicola]